MPHYRRGSAARLCLPTFSSEGYKNAAFFHIDHVYARDIRNIYMNKTLNNMLLSLVRRSLVLVLGAIQPSFQESINQGNPRELYLRNILAASEYPKAPTTPTSRDVALKIGIIGAGAAGLYAALLLDTLGIDYDIFESSGRVGGRIFTYRFNETAWANSTPSDPEYYDYYVSLPIV